MRIIEAVNGSPIYVGHQLDNEATAVQFDAFPFIDALGTTGTFSVYVQRYGETQGYVIGSPLVYVEDGYVYWKLTAADVAIAGQNECQLRYVVSEQAMMSLKYIYVVQESIVTGSTVPAPMQEWANEILAAVSEVVPMPEDMVHVPSSSSVDTVLGIEDGEVVQIPALNYAPENLTMSGTSTAVTTNNTFSIWRNGNTVTITVDCCMATAGSTSILTLPSQYRPPMNITSAIPNYTSSTVMKYITIYANGGVSIYVNSSTERLLFSMSWAVA